MSNRMPLPAARIGDVIVGDIHPEKGFVMFEVAYAEYDSTYGHWHYFNADKKLEVVAPWVDHIYKRKDLK